MTESDLAKIKFRFVMSMSGKYEQQLPYEPASIIDNPIDSTDPFGPPMYDEEIPF